MNDKPSRQSVGRFRLLLGVAALVVLLDQITKALVFRFLPLYYRKVIIPGFFDLVHVHNTGGAFSLLAASRSPFRHWFFVAIGLAALGVIFYLYRQTEASDWWTRFGLSLILGGALGNLIDRLRLGEVVDFLDFYIGPYHWPTFNVADMAITLGVCTLAVQLWRTRKTGVD